MAFNVGSPKFQTDLVPHPRLRFMLSSHAPAVSAERAYHEQRSAAAVAVPVLESAHMDVKGDPRPMRYRGDVVPPVAPTGQGDDISVASTGATGQSDSTPVTATAWGGDLPALSASEDGGKPLPVAKEAMHESRSGGGHLELIQTASLPKGLVMTTHNALIGSRARSADTQRAEHWLHFAIKSGRPPTS